MKPHDVRAVRKRLGLTQLKFAALLGVHEITVARWEAGTMGMSATAERLIRLLDQPKAAPKGRAKGKGRRAR